MPEDVSQLWFSHYLQQGPSSPVTTETDPGATNKDPEDIPTFDEWKRKVMEVEKEKSKIQSHFYTFEVVLRFIMAFLYLCKWQSVGF